MNIRHLMAFGLFGTLGALAGCSDGNDDYAGAEYQDETPAPTRSAETEPMADPDPMGTPGDQTAGMEDPMGTSGTAEDQTDALGERERTEFAALDTNTDGSLSQNEWQANDVRSQMNLKNRSFEQLDEDGSGELSPEEFQDAKADDPMTGGNADGAGLDLDNR